MSGEFVKDMLEANKAFQEAVTPKSDPVFMEVQSNKIGLFFVGPEAKPGDVCELLCVGKYFNTNGLECFRFQLRVKDAAA